MVLDYKKLRAEFKEIHKEERKKKYIKKQKEKEPETSKTDAEKTKERFWRYLVTESS